MIRSFNYCRILHLSPILQLTSRDLESPYSSAIMSHDQFISACETVPLGFLISTPKTLRILLVHKIWDRRFQSLLVKWTCTLVALLAAGIYGFSLTPTFLAVGVFAEGTFLFLLVLCISAGDILLDFALKDEWFFELATRCHALSIFEDIEFSLPQPVNFSSEDSRLSPASIVSQLSLLPEAGQWPSAGKTGLPCSRINGVAAV